MTFKLDPGALVAARQEARQEANQRAKIWQGGNTSSMNFADGMDLGLPSFGDYSGIPSGGPKIITPETGVFSSDGVGSIAGGHIASFGDSVELGTQALKGVGEVHRAEEYYEFAKEIAEERKKAQEEKERGALWGSIGRLGGTVLGTMAGGPMVGKITGQVGENILGSIG